MPSSGAPGLAWRWSECGDGLAGSDSQLQEFPTLNSKHTIQYQKATNNSNSAPRYGVEEV